MGLQVKKIEEQIMAGDRREEDEVRAAAFRGCSLSGRSFFVSKKRFVERNWYIRI